MADFLAVEERQAIERRVFYQMEAQDARSLAGHIAAVDEGILAVAHDMERLMPNACEDWIAKLRALAGGE